MKQCVTFYLDKFVFGVDVLHVQEVIRSQEMTPVPLATSGIGGLINLRGQIVTAVDLRRRLGLKDRSADSSPMNVVVRADSEAVSLLVDEIGDVIEIRQEQLEDPPETLTGQVREATEGVCKLQRELLLMLDVNRILRLAGNS